MKMSIWGCVMHTMWTLLYASVRPSCRRQSCTRQFNCTTAAGLYVIGWLGSWVVSVLDSEGPGFKSHPRRCQGNSLRQTVHTHCASVYQAAKFLAALLRVVGVIAVLAENNGSLLPGLWLTSPAGWLPRTGISSWTLRSVIEYGLPFYLYVTWMVATNQPERKPCAAQYAYLDYIKSGHKTSSQATDSCRY